MGLCDTPRTPVLSYFSLESSSCSLERVDTSPTAGLRTLLSYHSSTSGDTAPSSLCIRFTSDALSRTGNCWSASEPCGRTMQRKFAVSWSLSCYRIQLGFLLWALRWTGEFYLFPRNRSRTDSPRQARVYISIGSPFSSVCPVILYEA